MTKDELKIAASTMDHTFMFKGSVESVEELANIKDAKIGDIYAVKFKDVLVEEGESFTPQTRLYVYYNNEFELLESAYRPKSLVYDEDLDNLSNTIDLLKNEAIANPDKKYNMVDLSNILSNLKGAYNRIIYNSATMPEEEINHWRRGGI